ncbi:MAG: hypothetical protein EHM39_10475, partial [Chloroflexi bacterium]
MTISIDQRALGRPSPIGGICDAGAAEAHYSTVVSINRQTTPNPNGGATVQFRVTFSDSVTGGTIDNYDLTTVGNITGVSLATITGTGSTRTVTVNTGSGDGLIRLNMQNTTGITGVDSLSGVPFVTGQYMTIDKGIPNGLDAGCSLSGLSAIINAANLNGITDTIQLTSGCTYTFTAAAGDFGGPTALPDITTPMTFSGNGAILERSNAAPNFRLVNVSSTGALTLDKLTVRGGNAGSGGGVYADGALTITNSTFTNNTATNGGAVYYAGTTASHILTIKNSTFYANSAVDGGGLYHANSTTNSAISFATFSGNIASNSGSGIYRSAGTVRIKSTIVAPDTIAGGYTDFTQNFTSGDPMLGPLQNNRGPTFTRRPLDESPVVAMAIICTDVGGAAVSTDQRGYVRPQPFGDKCDIGAVELLTTDVASIVRADPNPTNASSLQFTVTFTETVRNVTVSNFATETTGTLTDTSVTTVSGAGAIWTVTVNTGTGDGELKLNMASWVGILDAASRPVEGFLFDTGQAYTID